MKRYTPWLTLIIVLLLSCNKEENTPDGNLVTYSKIIGASGGVISMDNLTLLEVPAGALDENVSLTATPTLYADDYYKLNDNLVAGYLGGVSFGPEGTVFNNPVKITLPVSKPLPPGSLYPLYFFKEESNAWIESGVYGKVNSDGLSVTAEVLHFTPWGVFDLPADLMMLEKFKDYFGIGDDPIGALNNYIEWFNSTIQPFEFRGLVQNCCYAIRGYEIEVVYKVNGIEDTMDRIVGESMPVSYPQFWFVYDDSDLSNTNEIYITINLKLHLGCKPDLTLSSAKSKLRLGEKTEIKACLTCGDKKISNAFLQVFSSPAGSLNKNKLTTNYSGEGVLTLTAEEEGIAELTASYEACKCETETEEYTAGLNVPIGDSETWTGRIELSAAGCCYAVCVSEFSGSVDFELLVKVSASGENQSILTVLNESVTLGNVEVSYIYTGYVNPGSPSIDLDGDVKYDDGQFIFKWLLQAGFGFEFCWYPAPGLALWCQDGYSCILAGSYAVETPLPVDSDHLTETGEIDFLCMQYLDPPATYTLTLSKQ